MPIWDRRLPFHSVPALHCPPAPAASSFRATTTHYAQVLLWAWESLALCAAVAVSAAVQHPQPTPAPLGAAGVWDRDPLPWTAHAERGGHGWSTTLFPAPLPPPSRQAPLLSGRGLVLTTVRPGAQSASSSLVSRRRARKEGGRTRKVEEGRELAGLHSPL